MDTGGEATLRPLRYSIQPIERRPCPVIRYKIDVMAALKDAGYSTYKIRKESLLHEMTLQRLRNKELVSWAVMDDICRLLNVQPGEIVEYVPTETESE